MDRRKAIREYKETRRPAGVYCVRNVRTGRLLLGSSANLPAVLNRHRAGLRLGSHPDRELQREWNEMGPDTFAFEVLDTLAPPEGDGAYDPRDDLRVLEQLWREKLEAQPTYSGKPGKLPSSG